MSDIVERLRDVIFIAKNAPYDTYAFIRDTVNGAAHELADLRSQRDFLEGAIADTADSLGCERDNEAILAEIHALRVLALSLAEALELCNSRQVDGMSDIEADEKARAALSSPALARIRGKA